MNSTAIAAMRYASDDLQVELRGAVLRARKRGDRKAAGAASGVPGVVLDPCLDSLAYRCSEGCPRGRTCCNGLAVEVTRREVRAIDGILDDGDPNAWNAGQFLAFYPGAAMHYRAKWYVERDTHPRLFGMGIHGQNLFVDRRNQIVVAKHSSQAMPMDAGRIMLTMRAVERLRAHLMAS